MNILLITRQDDLSGELLNKGIEALAVYPEKVNQTFNTQDWSCVLVHTEISCLDLAEVSGVMQHCIASKVPLFMFGECGEFDLNTPNLPGTLEDMIAARQVPVDETVESGTKKGAEGNVTVGSSGSPVGIFISITHPAQRTHKE